MKGQSLPRAPVYCHPRMAPRRPSQPEARPLAGREPDAVFQEVGIQVVKVVLPTTSQSHFVRQLP